MINKQLEDPEIARILGQHEFIYFEKSEIEQSLVQRFEKQVYNCPSSIAIAAENDILTYEQLNQIANNVALSILNEKDALLKKNLKTIHLLFEHGSSMVIGILSVLKAGCIYVPLDPNFPNDRINFILEDSECTVILTNNKNIRKARVLKSSFKKQSPVIINIDNIRIVNIPNIDAYSKPLDLAYILYTSGSTGKPKGVIQNHRNVLHFIRNYTNNLHISSNDKLTIFSAYTFDAAVMDIYGALLNGASLHIYDIRNQGLSKLSNWLKCSKISIFHSTPTVYRYFINSLKPNEYIKDVRLIVLGGESVLKGDLESFKKHFIEDCLLINGLGPTESTITLQYFATKNTNVHSASVPVGYPVEDTYVYIINKKGQECDINEIGELVFKSDHLALGYLNLPEKTNQVFYNDFVLGSGRIYRTGDLGKRLEDGCIEFFGRRDFQVKVRGYRIELNEVESKIDEIEGIKKSVITVHQRDTENFLVAYYTTVENYYLATKTLKELAHEKLPEYMIPSFFVYVSEFPHTNTGKIDRKRLTDHNTTLIEHADYQVPTNIIEAKLVNIWRSILKIDIISINDNFIHLGGHSLNAVELVEAIDHYFNVVISIKDISKNPILKDMANFINSSISNMNIGDRNEKKFDIAQKG